MHSFKMWLMLALIGAISCSDDGDPGKVGPDLGGSDGPSTVVDRGGKEGSPLMAPAVTFISPVSGQTVKGKTTVTVDVKPSSAIKEVKFSADGTAFATLTSAPWSTGWDTSQEIDGTYFLTATAKDSIGQTGSTTIKVIVSNPGATGDAKPSVKVIYPVDGAEVCGKLNVEAAASDDVGIDRVEFYVDGTKIGSTKVSPYQVNWDSTAVSDGQHLIKSVAYDSAGQPAQDKAYVKVANSGKCDNVPSVKFTSPAPGTKAVKGTVSLKATASDDVGVVKVQFFIDNAMLTEKKTIPYESSWDTSSLKEGAHTLKALAYDTASQTGKDVMQLFVDRTPPSVQITAPSGGTTVQDGDEVKVAATDNIALDKVTIRVNSTTVATLTQSPFSYKWTSTGTECGSNVITASACDLAGNCTTTSSGTTVTYIIGTYNYCAISGKCIGAGTPNPQNGCQKCNPTASTSSWSDDNGKVCDDNTLCTHSDVCQSGKCNGTAYTCDDKLTCTTDTCTGKSAAPAGCTFALNQGVCLISNTCVTSGAKNPNNACQYCDTSKSTAGWTADPTRCLIASQCYLSGAKNPADQCQYCDATTSTNKWTTHPSCPSAIQMVLNSMTMPNSGTTYAVDLDGNGTKDNQWGKMMGALSSFPNVSLTQVQIDSNVKNSGFPLVFDIQAKPSILNTSTLSLRTFFAVDLDSYPTDNFTGNEAFGISSSSPTNLAIQGQIVNGSIQAGPGAMIVPLSFIGSAPVFVSLAKAQVNGTITSKSIAAGQINGAIPITEVQTKLLPAMASWWDSQYKNTTDPTVKGNLKTMFDLNGDGTITANEVKSNLILGILIKADVDTDGDKKMDSMSIGFGFTSVTCKIIGL